MIYDTLKLSAWFVSPSNLILVLGITGLILTPTRFARVGGRFLLIGNLLFVIIGASPLGYVLTVPLEERFPQWDASQEIPRGIIILGGAIDPELSAVRGQISLNEAAERVTAIAALARQYPTVQIVFSGGSGAVRPTEAELTTRIFESFGISPERIVTESRSRDTAENASFTKALLNPTPEERWLLVTSAAHMPRAIGAFRHAGFQVEAYPVDWQTRGRQDLLSFFQSPLRGLNSCEIAIHEWIGLVTYWLNGRTTALFPGP